MTHAARLAPPPDLKPDPSAPTSRSITYPTLTWPTTEVVSHTSHSGVLSHLQLVPLRLQLPLHLAHRRLDRVVEHARAPLLLLPQCLGRTLGFSARAALRLCCSSCGGGLRLRSCTANRWRMSRQAGSQHP